MRIPNKNNGLSVQAISGTYTVLLGINAEESITKGLLGFAIHRTDHTENEQYYLKGFKTFEETEPNPVPGVLYSTFEHPVQSFSWGDYTAKPDHQYTYKITPLYGKPKNLEQKEGVEVIISTESVDTGTHAIYFNRGVAGSQAYFRKFQNKKPEEVENKKAFEWLSRGLEEAMLAFIRQANSPEYGLRAAVYEFYYLPVLMAFKQVKESGADAEIVYDCREESLREKNDQAIDEAGIRDLVKGRTEDKSYISHNKFIILLKNGQPTEVWTGSTNITKGGIFGQLNVGHIIRDPEIAKKFYAYWKELYNNPDTKDLRKWVVKETPDPVGTPQNETITALFSPRTTLDVLKWYAERLDGATQLINLTAAFGLHPLFEDVLKVDKDYLRYVLLDKEDQDFEAKSPDKEVLIAKGAKLEQDYLYRWVKEELTGYNVHVKYIHTKFMLLDPLSGNPTVITGSANFSEASTKNNDENMLVIQSDTRVADIYLGEFMRVFNHLYFRNVTSRQSAQPGTEERKSAYLCPDDSWDKRYYQKGSIKEKQRLLFSGS